MTHKHNFVRHMNTKGQIYYKCMQMISPSRGMCGKLVTIPGDELNEAELRILRKKLRK